MYIYNNMRSWKIDFCNQCVVGTYLNNIIYSLYDDAESKDLNSFFLNNFSFLKISKQFSNSNFIIGGPIRFDISGLADTRLVLDNFSTREIYHSFTKYVYLSYFVFVMCPNLIWSYLILYATRRIIMNLQWPVSSFGLATHVIAN